MPRSLLPFGTIALEGPSMLPTLRSGDQLLVHYGARVRPGDLVMGRHPLQQDLLVVKRAAERREGGWWVLSDNPYNEGDSRIWGTVPDELILGRVVGRYWPRPSWLLRFTGVPAADPGAGGAEEARLRAR